MKALLSLSLRFTSVIERTIGLIDLRNLCSAFLVAVTTSISFTLPMINKSTSLSEFSVPVAIEPNTNATERSS
jgi:hypothetical protein